MLAWMAVSVQREVAAINGKQDTFSYKVDKSSLQIGRWPAALVELGCDLGGPPCARSLFPDDAERGVHYRCGRSEKPRGKVDVLRRPSGASPENLVDPRVAETRQLGDAAMRKPKRRDPPHRALPLVLRRRQSGIRAGLNSRVISLRLQ